MLGDWRDGALSPFIPLAVIAPMILAVALSRFAFPAGRVLVVVFLALTVLLGGWLTAEWIYAGVPHDRVHPGYYLPTVAGGFVGAYCAALVGLHAIAEAAFGIGILCWILLAALVLNRLMIRPALPRQLVPTLAIQLAPPVIAGVAYFGVAGSKIDFVAAALGGYAVLMLVVQLRFLPLYARQKFTFGFWAFTFTSAAAAIDALLWLVGHPAGRHHCLRRRRAGPGHLLIGAIAVRSVIAIARGQFFPPRRRRRRERQRKPPGHARSARAITRRAATDRAQRACGPQQGPTTPARRTPTRAGSLAAGRPRSRPRPVRPAG